LCSSQAFPDSRNEPGSTHSGASTKATRHRISDIGIGGVVFEQHLPGAICAVSFVQGDVNVNLVVVFFLRGFVQAGWFDRGFDGGHLLTALTACRAAFVAA
jgi:hypothetical protein